MTALQFIVLSLACYRLTVLIARDIGPFGMFTKLRTFGKLFACPYCVSVWIGAIIEVVFYFTIRKEPIIIAACTALALSAVSIILDRMFTSDHKP